MNDLGEVLVDAKIAEYFGFMAREFYMGIDDPLDIAVKLVGAESIILFG